MRSFLSVGLLVLCLAACASASMSEAHMGCSSDTYVWGFTNHHEIFDGDSNLEFLRTATNATLYQVTVPNGRDAQSFHVVHVWGNAYQQGFAYGTVLKDEVNEFVDKAWLYIAAQLEEVLFPYLPDWVVVMITNIGLDAALDLVYDMTVEYTDPDFYEELRGLCDASGADYLKTRRLHMIPGLTKGACSMFGAWGDAIPEGGSLLQLRALDWDMDGPFVDFSCITIYHPDSTNSTQGHAWLNMGFVGFIGALTGMSEVQMAISEIGVSFADASWGPPQDMVPVPGVPFIVQLRDILKYDKTIDDSIERMATSKRTCNLILGVGDGKADAFRAFQYGPYVYNVFNDQNMLPMADWHPRMTDLVYYGMDWDCPSFNTVLSGQLSKYYGHLTPDVAVHNVSSVEQSGTNHIALYDLTKMEIYAAFGKPHSSSGPINAYNRQFTKFSVNDLFAESRP